MSSYLFHLGCPVPGFRALSTSVFISVVPAQIQSLVGPAAKGRWLGGMVACGAGNKYITLYV